MRLFYLQKSIFYILFIYIFYLFIYSMDLNFFFFFASKETKKDLEEFRGEILFTGINIV